MTEEEEQAAGELETLLVGERKQALTETQKLLLQYANAEAMKCSEQAKAIEEQGRQHLTNCVMALRTDLGLPLAIHLTFDREGNDVFVKWTPPLPEKPAPVAESPVGLALVPDDPEPAAT